MAVYTTSSFLSWSSIYESENITSGNSTNSSEPPSYNITSLPASSSCFVIQFQDYIPWNNPDSIVSLEVEDLMRALKDLIFLPISFLIGCPANIINMAVFYKHGLKERINVCLFALSLADELYLVNNMLWYGEQLYLRFTTKEMFGPVLTFLTNTHLVGFHGFIWVSQVLSAIISSERCFCILQPLRSQMVLKTSTMTVIIVFVNVLILGLVFFELMRYHIACAYDPQTGSTIMTTIPSEFYLRHQTLIDYLDVFVLGVGLPGLVIIVVVTTTILTTIKLRQAVSWRAEASSCAVTQKDIALTKMLVANSIFFIICVFPFVVFRFMFLFMPEVNIGRRQHNLYLSIQWILQWISYVNATFNIVVYYTMGSRYRQTFRQLFRKKKQKDNKK